MYPKFTQHITYIRRKFPFWQINMKKVCFVIYTETNLKTSCTVIHDVLQIQGNQEYEKSEYGGTPDG